MTEKRIAPNLHLNPLRQENNSAQFLQPAEVAPNSINENGLLLGQFDSVEIDKNSNSLGSESELLKQLETRIDEVAQKLGYAEEHEGFWGSIWSSIKNSDLFDKVTDSTNDIKRAIDEGRSALKSGDIKTAFETITGLEYTTENIEQFISGGLLTKSEQAYMAYDEGQEQAKDTVAGFATGVLSGMVYTAALGASFLASAPIVVTVGAAALVAGASGVAIKVGAKALEANSAGVEYNTIKKDAWTGFLDGALSPLAAISGGKGGSSLVSFLGGSTTTKKVLATTAEAVSEKAPNLLQNLSGNIYNGSNLVKAFGYATEFGVQGGMVGGADAAVRAVCDGGDSSEITQAAINGTVFGIGGGIVFGYGFKALGKGFSSPEPPKTYEIPRVNNNSGNLYSGLPIPELIKFLGKNSKAVNLDDVVEEYLMQRFITMKTMLNGSYEEFMKLPNGSQNPLIGLNISPRTFVEDVLFNEKKLSVIEMFEFRRFKQKFNIGELKTSIDDILSSYEVKPTTQVKTPPQISQKSPVEPPKPVKTATQEVVQELQDNAPSGGQKLDNTSVSSSSLKDVHSFKEFNDSHKIGRKPFVITKLRSLIAPFRKEEKEEIYNLLVDVYNRLNVKDNPACAFHLENFTKELDDLLLKSPNDEDAIKKLVNRYLEMDITDEISATPKTQSKPKSKSTNVTKKAAEEATKAQKLELLEMAVDIALEDNALPSFINGNSGVDIESLVAKYIKNSLAQNDGVVSSLREKNLSVEKMLEILSRIEKTVSEDVSLGAKVSSQTTKELETEIKDLILEYRLAFMQKIKKELGPDFSNYRELIDYCNKKFNWNISSRKYEAFIEYVNLKDEYAELYERLKPRNLNLLSPDKIRLGETHEAGFLLDVFKNIPNFDIKNFRSISGEASMAELLDFYHTLSDTQRSAFFNFLRSKPNCFDAKLLRDWLSDVNFQNRVPLEDCLVLHGKGIPREKLYSSGVSILDVFGVKKYSDFNEALFGSVKTVNNGVARAIDQVYKMFDVLNVSDLTQKINKYGIKSFSIKNHVNLKNKFEIELDFTGSNMPISERMAVISEIFQNLNGPIAHMRPSDDLINGNAVLLELAAQLKKNISNSGDYLKVLNLLGINDHNSLISLAGLSPNHPMYKRAYTNFLRKNQNFSLLKLSKVCEFITDPKLEIFNGIHGKLRFFERFYFKYHSIDDALEAFTEAFNKKVRINIYTDNLGRNSKIFAPKCQILLNEAEYKGADLTIDAQGKFHTLFNTPWGENF